MPVNHVQEMLDLYDLRWKEKRFVKDKNEMYADSLWLNGILRENKAIIENV